MEHHLQRVAEEARRMRIALRVGEGVVLAVQDGVAARRQVRRALRQIGEQVEPALDARRHGVHAVGRVAVLEEALEEHAREPVTDEENVDHAEPPSL